MANPQIRPGGFAGSARIAGAGTLINATGIITGMTKTGTGQYTLTIDPGASPNEHNFTVTPILTGFNADASGTVDVSGASPVVQTSVGGVAADCDCYVEVKRVLTADGKIFSTPAAVPSGPPPPPGGGGLTLLGSNLTEVSSTSLSLALLTSVSGLSIPITQPFWIGFDFRKSTGAAVAPVFGLRLNTVDINDASAQPIAFTGGVNEAQSGHCLIRVGRRDANYLRGGVATQAIRGATDGADSNAPIANTAALPSVAITDVTITGKTPNTAVTFASKNVFVWAPPIT